MTLQGILDMFEIYFYLCCGLAFILLLIGYAFGHKEGL